MLDLLQILILTYGPIDKFLHSFTQAISIAPLQVLYYSEALPSQHGYCARISGNCE